MANWHCRSQHVTAVDGAGNVLTHQRGWIIMNSGTVARGLYLLLSLAPAAHQLLYLPWHSLVSRAPCCPHNVSVRASGYPYSSWHCWVEKEQPSFYRGLSVPFPLISPTLNWRMGNLTVWRMGKSTYTCSLLHFFLSFSFIHPPDPSFFAFFFPVSFFFCLVFDLCKLGHSKAPPSRF